MFFIQHSGYKVFIVFIRRGKRARPSTQMILSVVVFCWTEPLKDILRITEHRVKEKFISTARHAIDRWCCQWKELCSDYRPLQLQSFCVFPSSLPLLLLLLLPNAGDAYINRATFVERASSFIEPVWGFNSQSAE